MRTNHEHLTTNFYFPTALILPLSYDNASVCKEQRVNKDL